MGRVEAILAVALAASTIGCALNGKPRAAGPAQPQPAAAPKPAQPSPQPPEPLSVPQTQVQLPPPQPVNRDAIVPVQPQEPAGPVTAPRTSHRTGGGSPQPKPEVVAPAVQPPERERPPIQEIVPADERRRYRESAVGSKREIRQLLEQAKAQRLTSDQRVAVKRIQSFVAQSDDAERHGDMRQADALAERGLVLARELAGGK